MQIKNAGKQEDFAQRLPDLALGSIYDKEYLCNFLGTRTFARSRQLFFNSIKF